jgi:hypothetical protein
MADPQSELSILVDIRAKLDALVQAQAGLRNVAEDAKAAHEQASELGSLFTQGLGIGSGMELARRAVELFRSTFTEAVRQSSQLAAEVERAHGRLGLQGEAYQTLAAEARAAGTEFSEVMSSMAQYRAQLGELLLDPTKGSALKQIGEDARDLANVPLERQLERIAVGLGKVTDGNVRARLTQELFGRGAAAITPLLERLRVEGYDKLRDSAQQTNAILGDGMADALNKAQTKAEEAQKRLGVALAPLNLRLIEAKTQLVGVIARNAGAIQSGIEASFAGALTGGVEKALERIEKNGGLEVALKNFGKTMAGPVGVGLATALGAFLIKELERHALEANQRSVEFGNREMSKPKQIQDSIADVQNGDQLRELYNKAVIQLTEAKEARKKLIQTPMQTKEEREQLAILDQEIQRFAGLIPLIKARGEAAIAANRAARVDFDELTRAETKMMVLEAEHTNYENGWYVSARSKQIEDVKFFQSRIVLLEKIIELTKKLPQPTGQDPLLRDREIKKLENAKNAAEVSLSNAQHTVATDSEYSHTRNSFEQFRNTRNERGEKHLTASEGIEAGAMQWSMSLGTQGEQVSQSLQSSIGTTVHSISEAINGWATGAENFGSVVQQMESSLFQTLLDTLVQMGVQWLINAALAKGSLISTFLVAVGLRKAETADVVANETVKAGPIMANAAGSSISSFGLAAALGIAALVAVMAAFGGFSAGGYTGPGGVNDPAGIVHAGEVVFSQRDVARFGGASALENLRVAGPSAAAITAPSLSVSSALAANSSASHGKTERLIAFAENYTDIRNIKRQAGWDRAVIETVTNNLGEILSR